MGEANPKHCTAFQGSRRIASGEPVQVAMAVKEVIDRGEGEPVLIFDHITSELIEVDFRGAMNDVLQRVKGPVVESEQLEGPVDKDKSVPRGPGRPRLGVVSREVGLLPRHWDWLNSQPGGASVALRKLVEEARRIYSDRDKIRQSQEAAYRFMSAMAGNLPGFEEATRALFAGDPGRFDSLVAPWPIDIRNHAQTLSYVALHNRESVNSAQ